MDSVLQLLKDKTLAKGARIKTRYGGEPPIAAVAGELRQVFSNLLVNSLDAISENGVIRVHISPRVTGRKESPCIRITVADDGKGISRSSLARVFEPLFTTKETLGTGLGLWVAKQLMHKHGGSIRVRSADSGPRHGTTFSLVLPAAPGEAQLASKAQGA